MNDQASQNESTTGKVGRASDDESAAELRTRLDALLNDPLDAWVENMHFGGSAAEFEKTLSWRITKPLRAARTFQIRVGQLGLAGAVAHSGRFLRRRLARK